MPGRNLQHTHDSEVYRPTDGLRLAVIATEFGAGNASGAGRAHSRE